MHILLEVILCILVVNAVIALTLLWYLYVPSKFKRFFKYNSK